MTESSVGPDVVSVALSTLPLALAIEVQVAEVISVLTAAGAAAPSGAITLILAIDAAAILATVTNPVPFFTTGVDWHTVSGTMKRTAASLEAPIAEFASVWTGEAADAFNEFWANRMKPILPSLAELATSCGTMLISFGVALISVFIGILTTTIGLITGLLAADAAAAVTFGSSLLTHWPMVGGWGTVIAGIITALLAFASATVGILADVNGKLETLKGYAIEETAGLERNRIQVPDTALPDVRADIEELDQITDQYQIKP